MTKMYSEEELLALSGIQHMAFCERQWALIHVERQWAESVRTVEGHNLHKKVDNPYLFEARGGLLTARAVPVASYRLGLYGVCDVVEFEKTDETENSTVLSGRKGHWQPFPVEYKRGNIKKDDRDEVQLCAQALCLEEMHGVKVDKCYLYYGEIHHRVTITLSEDLRKRVVELTNRMHLLFQEGVTPKAVKEKKCRLCSLIDICVPEISTSKMSVSDYLKRSIDWKGDDSG